MDEFIRAFNEKFAVEPRSDSDAHRPLVKAGRLEQILKDKQSRVLSKNLQLSYKGVIYQIVSKRPSYAMRYQRVWVY